jgi:hypothetical protein
VWLGARWCRPPAIPSSPVPCDFSRSFFHWFMHEVDGVSSAAKERFVKVDTATKSRHPRRQPVLPSSVLARVYYKPWLFK